MKNYPLTSGLREAIERLFDDPSVAHGALGLERVSDGESFEPSCDASTPAVTRAAMLHAKLVQYIAQMAREHEEMGSPEASDTLRMQAVGLLIALRELSLHFPELQG